MALSNGVLLKERYRIDCVLGQGGMGAVYQATDELFGIKVAVKENLFLSEEYTRQFEQEAKILAFLRHKSLPRVVDFYRIPGQGQYLIMDHIDGEDLRDLIKRWGKLTEKDVVLIGYHICEALKYLHSSIPPVIHRDIKPGNIKITKNQEIFLVDFGLAKLVETPEQMTITGARAMTPGYSPPEQYGTARTDARSDIYSLGATLYNALTGAVPEDALERVTKRTALTPILTHRDSTEPNLVRVIERAMEIDTDERYQTVTEFQQALLNASAMESISIGAQLFSQFDCITAVQSKDYLIGDVSFSNKKSIKKGIRNTGTDKGMSRRLKSWQIWSFSILLLVAMLGIFMINPEISQRIRSLNEIISFSDPTNQSTEFVISTLNVDIIQNESQTKVATITPTQTVTQINTPIRSTPTLTKTEIVVVSKTDSNNEQTVTPDNSQVELANNIFLPDDYPVVYASSNEGSIQLWLMKPDGSDHIRLTDMPNGACQPSWSPDAMKIVFISPCRKIQDSYDDAVLYVYDFAEKNAIPLMPVDDPGVKVGNYEPAWSPDGESIVFTSVQTGISHIFLYFIDSKEIREVSNTSLEDRQASWHPDGNSLIFGRKRVNWVLWTISTTGNDLRQVSVSGNVSNFQPAWSPDGEYILYSQSDTSKVPWLVKLYEGDFGSTYETKIFAKGEEFFVPVLGAKFSSDGTKIIFESWPDGKNRDIYVMDLDGTNVTRLTTNPDYDIDPDWH